MAQKTSEKKVVSRTVAIALVVICVVLAAGVIGTIAIYVPQVSDLQSQMASKDNMIVSLNSQVSSLTLQVSSLSSQIASLQSSSYSASYVQNIIGNYTQQLSDYDAIVSLSKSASLVQSYPVTQGPSSNSSIWNDSNSPFGYAGYVTIEVTSNSTTTYAEVTYALPVTEEYFDYNVTVGTSGTAVFPVLPGPIWIGIGNTELSDAVNATVTAVYYY